MNKKLRAQLIKINHRFKIRKKDLSKKIDIKKDIFYVFQKRLQQKLASSTDIPVPQILALCKI